MKFKNIKLEKVASLMSAIFPLFSDVFLGTH